MTNIALAQAVARNYRAEAAEHAVDKRVREHYLAAAAAWFFASLSMALSAALVVVLVRLTTFHVCN